MDFFDEVYKKLTETAGSAAAGTEKITEIAKLKFNLMREKSRLEEAYKRLGEIYYKQMKSGDLNEKMIAVAFDRIEKYQISIEDLNMQINSLKNTRVCEYCGEKLDKSMQFCHKCGARVKVEKPDEE